jgi:outer membrane murein-binding lipoprotein Lpp
MAALLLLLAVFGGILVGDLVLENTAAGGATLLHHPITGYSEGQLLAVAAALGFIVGLLVVGSVSLRRTRRARRRQLRTAERDLTAQLAELERENASLREDLADLDPPVRRPGAAAVPADHGIASAAPTAERRARVRSTPVDRHPEPVYEEARRAARLRSDLDR